MNSLRKRNEYIYTYTGLAIHPEEFTPDCVRIEDIAHALANIRRFNGHSRVSVLRHSMGVASRFIRGTERWRWAMMHDAAEAYVMDVPKPLQPYIGSRWSGLHATVENAVIQRFDLLRGDDVQDVMGDVKRVDNEVVEYEMDCGMRLHSSRMAYPCDRKMLPSAITALDRAYNWTMPDDLLVEVFISQWSEYGA